MNTHVYIVDDDRAVRESLTALLDTDPSLESRSFDSGESFLAAVRSGLPAGVVLLDILMPGASGFDVLERMRDHPGFAVIVITAHGDTRQAIQAARMGARDFLEKPFEWTALFEAIIEACAEAPADDCTSPRAVDAREGIALLTRREVDVLELMLRGLMNKVIGHRLGLSIRTVEVHRANIFRKLRVENQIAVIHKLFRAGQLEVTADHLCLSDQARARMAGSREPEASASADEF